MATLADIKAVATSVVAEASQRNTKFTATTDNRLGLIDRIGSRVMIDGDEAIDHLPELDGNDRTNGRTIEEYFLGFTAPTARNKADGIGNRAYPDKKQTYFNYPLKEQKWKVSIAYEDLEKATTSSEEAGNLVSRIRSRQGESRDIFVYDEKKQLLANAIAKAAKATNKATLVEELAKPTDTASGEAFIKKLKDIVRRAKFMNSENLTGELAKGVGSLTLYVTPGIRSSLEVDTESGAFHDEKLAPGCEIKELDDFGNADAAYYAILVDTRGIKLHKNYQFSMTQPLADPGAYDNVLHYGATGFISGYSFIHVFKVPA